MSARDAILARIRDALRERPEPSVAAAAYRRRSDLSRAETLLRFEQRLADYHVGVHHAQDEDAIASLAAHVLAARGIASLVVAVDFPQSWRPDTPAAREDRALPHDALDGIAGAMTASLLAIAESGTIVLDGGPGQGRRALTLLPDYHLCVVFARDVVGLLPEAMPRLHASVSAGAPLTFFSGPSATADIELDRVEGVHGPRTLDVILVA